MSYAKHIKLINW